MPIGTDIGTDTICAPTTSLSFQPNPLLGPYALTSEAGASSGVRWQARHFGSLIWIGWPRNSERPSGVSRSPMISRALRVAAELVDDVGLPVHRPVARVGGVERRLLVLVFRVGLAQGVEDLGRRVRRHRLRKEVLRKLRVEERLDLPDRITAHRHRGLHHDARVLDHLRARASLEERVRESSGRHQRQREDRNQRQVELGQQTHRPPPVFAAAGVLVSRAFISERF